MPGNPKGDRRERELARMLSDDGCFPMRAPASGSSTERDLPDVHVGQNGFSVAIEAKSSSGDPIYIGEEELEALDSFAFAFGSIPLVGVRFDREDWYFFLPEDLYRTHSGNGRVKKKTAIEDGMSYDELLRTLLNGDNIAP